jgi:hypothetical protein
MSFYEVTSGVTIADLHVNRNNIKREEWVINDVLPVGFSILAGREKSGKSLLTMGSLAIPISLGVNALGIFSTKPGTVLYFALEEARSTIIDRVDRFFSEQSDSWHPPDNMRIYWADSIDLWSEKALQGIEEIILGFSDVRCVIIDTLAHVAPAKNSGNYADSYDRQYHIGSQIQQLALQHDVAILAVHHTTKTTYNDVFDSIGGFAWTKACETMMVIERVENSKAKLHVRGRSIATTTWEVVMNQDTLLWTAQGNAVTNDQYGARQSAITVISPEQVFAKSPTMRRRDIIALMKLHDFSESTTDRWLTHYQECGQLQKLTDGQGYAIINRVTRHEQISSLFDPIPEGICHTNISKSQDSFPDQSVPPPPVGPLGNDDGGGSLDAVTSTDPDQSVPPPPVGPLGNDDGGGSLDAVTSTDPDQSVPPPPVGPLGNDDGGGSIDAVTSTYGELSPLITAQAHEPDTTVSVPLEGLR